MLLKQECFLSSIFMVVLIASLLKNVDGSKENVSCPTWMISNDAESDCICGDDLNGVVLCDQQMRMTYLLNCYCMSFDWKRNISVVGSCAYTCHNLLSYSVNTSIVSRSGPFYQLSQSKEDLKETCTALNRKGLHCGDCMRGYSAPVFSYSLECTLCTDSPVLISMKLFLTVFLPQTTFYIIVLVFRIHITSPKFTAFVFVSQICGLQQIAKDIVTYSKGIPKYRQILNSIFIQLCSMWNLDFFRFAPLSVCIPNLDTRTAMYLELVPAVYPLLLASLVILLIELHGRGCKILTAVWSPFYHCFTKFRHNWNIQTSIVDALATFFILSNVKIASTILMLLTIFQERDIYGRTLGYWNYYQPSAHELRPTGHMFVGALVLLFFLTIFPLLLILLYPVKKFRKHVLLKLLFRSTRSRLALKAFMDSLQGCYKDGTEPNTRDHRYIAGLYLLLKLGLYLEYMISTHNISTLLVTMTLTGFGFFILATKPYKNKYKIYNIVDAFFLVELSLFMIFANGLPLVVHEGRYMAFYEFFMCLLASMMPGYLLLLVLQLILTSTYAKNLLAYLRNKLKRFYMKDETRSLVEQTSITRSALNVNTDAEDLIIAS